MNCMLKDTFFELLKKYTNDDKLIESLWHEIQSAYTHKSRYYHTLSHLENLLHQLSEVKSKISNWDAVLFSLYYHDIVYNSLKSDNEEKSAVLAEKSMQQLNVPEEIKEICREQILATKSHQVSTNSDTNYFTDADLSILGAPQEIYTQYFKDVRKEYSIYPDFVYNMGRKKALKHFLTMERIFKTYDFYQQYEEQAKINLQNEIDTFK